MHPPPTQLVSTPSKHLLMVVLFGEEVAGGVAAVVEGAPEAEDVQGVLEGAGLADGVSVGILPATAVCIRLSDGAYIPLLMESYLNLISLTRLSQKRHVYSVTMQWINSKLSV